MLRIILTALNRKMNIFSRYTFFLVLINISFSPSWANYPDEVYRSNVWSNENDQSKEIKNESNRLIFMAIDELVGYLDSVSVYYASIEFDFIGGHNSYRLFDSKASSKLFFEIGQSKHICPLHHKVNPISIFFVFDPYRKDLSYRYKKNRISDLERHEHNERILPGQNLDVLACTALFNDHSDWHKSLFEKSKLDFRSVSLRVSDCGDESYIPPHIIDEVVLNNAITIPKRLSADWLNSTLTGQFIFYSLRKIVLKANENACLDIKVYGQFLKYQMPLGFLDNEVFETMLCPDINV